MSNFDRRRVNGPISHPPIYDPLPSTSGASSSAASGSTLGTRNDGRSYTQQRPIFLQTNLVPSASGSSYIEIGDLKLACSVFGPRQVKGRQYSGRAELNVEVKFAPFSSRRRRRPGKTTESAHLSALLHQALLPSLRLELLPKASLDIHIMVLQTDGLDDSCIAAACVAASTALASAGIEMYGLVVANVGLVDAKGHVLVDPSASDLVIIPPLRTATRILLCGMPALASTTCLHITAGASAKLSDSSNPPAAPPQPGILPSSLDTALDTVNASLIDIHKVVANALAQDFERRRALIDSPVA
ncbi:ribosomal protein S5 domain 2-like protein [Testicularia cyperi]|uniref:Ribosomal protein S5 domain 2-like protein n=1 Tax=Testicularia cyperi TaxID=1882483 RepID=A0A317XIQ2_9BASI|nr:ribosomal protein S5 domain 2-like protein [Testicularia cyperi]